MFKWLFSLMYTLLLVALLFSDHWKPVIKIFFYQDQAFFHGIQDTSSILIKEVHNENDLD